MAIKSVCKIDECGKRVVARGMCDAHYRRWKKYGDPRFRIRRPSGEAMRYFQEVVAVYDGDDCLFWPFTRHTWGYGQLWTGEGNEYVHTLLCEQEHGRRPSPAHEAAHSCGNGHLGCVTKRHLSWKTPVANTADKFGHGTIPFGEQCWNSKLDESQVRTIRKMRGKAPQSQIANQFGVKQAHVANIQLRKRWAWLE